MIEFIKAKDTNHELIHGLSHSDDKEYMTQDFCVDSLLEPQDFCVDSLLEPQDFCMDSLLEPQDFCVDSLLEPEFTPTKREDFE